MLSLAQPGRSSFQRADSTGEPAGAKPTALPRTEISTVTIAVYLRKDAKGGTARRCRMIAGATAGTAALNGSTTPRAST
jgi:hypothetical protein